MTAPDRLITRHVVINVVALIVSLGSCIVSIVVWNHMPSPPPPLMLADVQRRATDDLRHLAESGHSGGLGPSYTLEAKPDEVTNCRKPDGLESGQKTVTVTLAVHGVEPARLSDYFLLVRAWLPDLGWDVRTKVYETRDHYLVNATRDGYLVTARTDANGVIMFANSTPCAEPPR
jgi:hypothetical protein